MKYVAAALMSLLPISAFAHDYAIDGLKVEHPIAKATTETARASAGYLSITNTGETSDRLVAVEADFPRVMVHDTVVEDGVASMVHMDSITLESGQTVVFEPGGLHVMFMGLSDQMIEGQKIPGTLIFENAGRLDIEFNVENLDGDAHANH